MAIASTLSLDGQDSAKGDGSGWRETRSGEATLADSYDYVCYGKLYRFDESEDGNTMYEGLVMENMRRWTS